MPKNQEFVKSRVNTKTTLIKRQETMRAMRSLQTDCNTKFDRLEKWILGISSRLPTYSKTYSKTCINFSVCECINIFSEIGFTGGNSTELLCNTYIRSFRFHYTAVLLCHYTAVLLCRGFIHTWGRHWRVFVVFMGVLVASPLICCCQPCPTLIQIPVYFS